MRFKCPAPDVGQLLALERANPSGGTALPGKPNFLCGLVSRSLSCFRRLEEATNRGENRSGLAFVNSFMSTVLHDAGQNIARRFCTGHGSERATGVMMALA